MTMAFQGPPPEDDDETFRKLTESLDLNVTAMAETVVSSLSDIEIVEKFNATRRELHQRREIPHANTQVGRDLQSQYYALMAEGKKRGLM